MKNITPMRKLKTIKKPWGKEIWFAHTSDYAGKIILVKKGHRLSLQYHKKKAETLFLESGILKVSHGRVNGKLKTNVVRSGYIFNVLPKTVHRTEAVTDCRIIEVSTPYLTDVVRLEDDYNRKK